jgi:replicative DNA helicase
MTKEEWGRFALASKELSEKSLYFSSPSYANRSVYDIVSYINSEFSLVIIDDVLSIDSDNTFGKDKTYNTMRILKAVAIEKKVPLLVLAPISNNKTAKRADHRPMLQDFENDSLIDFSDTILFLYKESNPDIPLNILEVIVAKNNAGETGMTNLAVDGDKIFDVELSRNT